MRHSFVSAVLLALLLTACGGGASDASDEPEPTEEPAPLLQTAYDTCSPDVETGMQEDFKEDAPALVKVFSIDDGGESIVIGTPDNASLVVKFALAAATCVLKETDAPSSILANMQSTTAMMGRQSAEYDNVVVTWSFTADSYGGGGFQATFDES